MWIRWTRRGTASLVLIAGVALAGCDMVEPETQTQPQQQANQQAPTQQQAPAQQQPTRTPQQSSPLGAGVAQAQEQPTPLSGTSEQAALSEYEQIINGVYERDINGVVNLTDGQTAGSGFIIDDQGYIVTNNHVIAEMNPIIVTFNDGSQSEAQLVGTFPNGDIAVVQVQSVPESATPVELGDSSTLRIGQIVIAIGSPLNLEQTVTSGIVSALNRSNQDLGNTDPDSSLQGLIQTDAPINPGNSGGPLFDSQGRVIGMNTLIATLNQGSVGLGFAVPVNRIKRVVPQLIQNGEYRRPLLGVTISEITPELAQRLNFPTSRGVIIGTVAGGGPAEQAGLQGATEGVQLSNGEQYPTNGDIIIRMNDTEIQTLGDLRNFLETSVDAGDTVTITFLRDGQEQQTQLTLASS